MGNQVMSYDSFIKNRITWDHMSFLCGTAYFGYSLWLVIKLFLGVCVLRVSHIGGRDSLVR